PATHLWLLKLVFFFSSRRRHTRFSRDWSSDVCSSDLQRADDDLVAHPGLLQRVEVGLEHRHRRGEEGREADDVGLVLLDRGEERSEERRVGKECRSRWALEDSRKRETSKKTVQI